MLLILRRDDEPRISKRTAIIVGSTLGSVYLLVSLILIYVFLRRRRRKRLLLESRKGLHIGPETVFLGFSDRIPSSRSRNQSAIYTRSPTRRLIYTEDGSEGDGIGSIRSPARCHTRRFHHAHPSLSETISTRPPTRRSGGHRRNLSDSTVIRSQPSNTNPFWMFDSANSESSFHTFRRHSDTSLSTCPSITAFHSSPTSPSTLSMPTSVFVSEMNARYPTASILPPPSISTKSLAQIRHVPRSRSTSPTSPSPSERNERIVVRKLRDKQEEGFLPPVPILPLMHKKSIERIVSGQYFSQRKSRSEGSKGKGKVRARTREKAKESGEIVRLVTVKRVTGRDRKVVDVDERVGEGKGHARNKSLSALSERLLGMWRKSRMGIIEDVKDSELEAEGSGFMREK